MKSRMLIIWVSVTTCGLSVAAVVLQARQLDALRGEGQRLQQQLQELRDEEARPTPPAGEAKPVITSPSSELLRLRNQVSQLTRRQRELANVAVENERLRGRVASAQPNASPALPPGYLRTSEARNLGYASPEAALETLLWAIQNRDVTNVLAAFTPRIARNLQEQLQQKGDSTEEFFKQAGALPGFNILERGAVSNDAVEFKVEIVPGSGEQAQPMRFRLINGEWKLDSQ